MLTLDGCYCGFNRHRRDAKAIRVTSATALLGFVMGMATCCRLPDGEVADGKVSRMAGSMLGFSLSQLILFFE